MFGDDTQQFSWWREVFGFLSELMYECFVFCHYNLLGSYYLLLIIEKFTYYSFRYNRFVDYVYSTDIVLGENVVCIFLYIIY